MNGVNILDVRKYKSGYVWWVKWKTTGNLLLRKDESNFRLVHAPTSSQVNKSWRNVCRLKRSQTTLWLNVSVKLRPQFYIQVNLCQKLLFLHPLTHNMTTLNYKFNTWRFQAQMFCKKKSFWQRFTCMQLFFADSKIFKNNVHQKLKKPPSKVA